MDKFRLIPPQASTSAHQIDWLFIALVAIMLFFLISVFFPITWFAIKYRCGSDANRLNPSHCSNLIEIGWTTLPIVLSVALFSWGAVAYYHIERPPPNALQVQIVGKQFGEESVLALAGAIQKLKPLAGPNVPALRA